MTQLGVRIWGAMVPRLNEFIHRKKIHTAYLYAFTVGLQADIEEALKDRRLKINAQRQKNRKAQQAREAKK